MIAGIIDEKWVRDAGRDMNRDDCIRIDTAAGCTSFEVSHEIALFQL